MLVHKHADSATSTMPCNCQEEVLKNQEIQGCGNIFFIGLSLQAIEITLKSGFKFLIACLDSEILKDKDMAKR